MVSPSDQSMIGQKDKKILDYWLGIHEISQQANGDNRLHDSTLELVAILHSKYFPPILFISLLIWNLFFAIFSLSHLLSIWCGGRNQNLARWCKVNSWAICTTKRRSIRNLMVSRSPFTNTRTSHGSEGFCNCIFNSFNVIQIVVSGVMIKLRKSAWEERRRGSVESFHDGSFWLTDLQIVSF